MRTTAKPVVEAIRAHILEAFEDTVLWHYENNPDDMQDYTTVTALVSQIDSMRHHDRTIYATALDYVEGGSLLVYYSHVNDFMRDTLQQTVEESNSFSDEKTWRLYCHLVAREMTKLYEGAK